MSRLRQGAVVVITGAASGIGRSAAMAFARKGCRLVLGDVNGDAVAETARRIKQRTEAEIVTLGCDVRVEDDVRALVDEAVKRFGRLDVMVNNAGEGYYARIEDTPSQDFEHLFDTNVMGVHHGIRAAAPVMRQQGWGHIVVVGSVNGKQSWPYHGAYSATKFALTGLTQALRMELAGSGVTASLVLPVNVKTGFFSSARVASGYEPRPIGRSYSSASVARRIVRSAERPSPEVNTVPAMRLVYLLGEVMPLLADIVGRRWYLRQLRRGTRHN